jgi:PAS domain S-box-containing protein
MRQSKIVPDTLLVIGVATLACFAAAFFDLYEQFGVHTRSLESWEIDEIPLILLVLAGSCVWFAHRRRKELAAEINERRRVEQALLENETRYRTLVEASLQGMYIYQDGCMRFVNRALASMFGYHSPDELLEQEVWLLVAPHDKTRLEDGGYAAIRGRPNRARHEWQGVCKDGTSIWVESMASLVLWNGASAVLTTVVDITERKRQEQERCRIAYEIHDGIAQLMASAQQHLETFVALWQDDAPSAGQQLERGLDRLHQAIVASRRLMTELHPVALDALDLIPAVQQVLEELGKETGWETEFIGTSEELSLTTDEEAALFLMLQEALTNARKHANTPKVRVEFKREGKQGEGLMALIKDWGMGFQPDKVCYGEPHLGLLGMRERARLLGGTCTIASGPGQGTSVLIRIPLRQGAGL